MDEYKPDYPDWVDAVVCSLLEIFRQVYDVLF